MPNDPGPGHEPSPPDGRATPPPYARPGAYVPADGPPPPPARPRPLSIASGLWVALGVLFILGMLGYLGGSQSPGLTGGPLIPVLFIGLGAAFIVLASRLRRGKRDTRTALTVLGALVLIGVWPVLLVVPAIVLQYRPDCSAWLRAVGAPQIGK